VSVSRPWLALVLVLFCLPLFFGLRSVDLDTDEAIYSFAVDRILEMGEWLQPKSSPSETAVFLEKPPLKFWIVAAPIRAGILPHDELGLRFWDALFGAISFVYVFAIGNLLAGPVCGAVAVLLLFVHGPLLFEHGLRSNSMEGPLFLCYCGGVYHFLQWARARGRRGPAHALGVGLYFVLGFMTKFVAALFLPAVLAVAALMFRSTRAKVAAGWKPWLAVSGVVVGLIAPWFIYAHVQFGRQLWETMFAAHVYERFTTGLNQTHLHPWNYYVVTMAGTFASSGVQWLVLLGVFALLVQSLRRRWFEGAVVLLWAIVPLALISAGSSKLYHYAYPFIPPVTIAAGYGVALFVMLAPVVLRKILERVEDATTAYLPRLRAGAERPWLRGGGTLLIWLGAAAITGALIFGVVRIGVGKTQLFKSSGLLRPLVVIVLAGLLTRRSALIATLVVVLMAAWWMPVRVYETTVRQFSVQKHPIRDVSECLRRVASNMGAARSPGIYADMDDSMWHPIYYYFRRLPPWTHQRVPAPELLDRNLRDPAAFRPSLVQEQRYREYQRGPQAGLFNRDPSTPLVAIGRYPFEYVLLLPGPYGACSPEAALHTAR
jgi:4-amino-4-deoxy-L-arabinose transferase-like glycosyltransferase